MATIYLVVTEEYYGGDVMAFSDLKKAEEYQSFLIKKYNDEVDVIVKELKIDNVSQEAM